MALSLPQPPSAGIAAMSHHTRLKNNKVLELTAMSGKETAAELKGEEKLQS